MSHMVNGSTPRQTLSQRQQMERQQDIFPIKMFQKGLTWFHAFFLRLDYKICLFLLWGVLTWQLLRMIDIITLSCLSQSNDLSGDIILSGTIQAFFFFLFLIWSLCLWIQEVDLCQDQWNGFGWNVIMFKARMPDIHQDYHI